jgi:hypothetical protein
LNIPHPADTGNAHPGFVGPDLFPEFTAFIFVPFMYHVLQIKAFTDPFTGSGKAVKGPMITRLKPYSLIRYKQLDFYRKMTAGENGQ